MSDQVFGGRSFQCGDDYLLHRVSKAGISYCGATLLQLDELPNVPRCVKCNATGPTAIQLIESDTRCPNDILN